MRGLGTGQWECGHWSVCLEIRGRISELCYSLCHPLFLEAKFLQLQYFWACSCVLVTFSMLLTETSEPPKS